MLLLAATWPASSRASPPGCFDPRHSHPSRHAPTGHACQTWFTIEAIWQVCKMVRDVSKEQVECLVVARARSPHCWWLIGITYYFVIAEETRLLLRLEDSS